MEPSRPQAVVTRNHHCQSELGYPYRRRQCRPIVLGTISHQQFFHRVNLQMVALRCYGEFVEPHHSLAAMWNFHEPVRVSFTLWAILHRALSTTEFLWTRRILSSSGCLACGHLVQSCLHFLRDCTISAHVLHVILDTYFWDYFFCFTNEVSWVLDNISQSGQISLYI